MKNWIWADAKTPGLIDHKRPHISNIGSFMIDQSRGFGTAEIPILHVVWVYMHIIGGKFKKWPIITPKSDRVRPTTSQLREAVFNICQNKIENATFLDLFAGCGAMGLEALSRGAQHVTFVDHHRAAIHCIKQNIAALGIESQTTLYPYDALKALQKMAAHGKLFEMIYVDPPYGQGLSDQVLEFLDSYPLLAPGGSLFLEDAHLKQTALSHLHLKSDRSFGRAKLFEFQRISG